MNFSKVIITATIAVVGAATQAHAIGVMNGGYCTGSACGTMAGCAPEAATNNLLTVDAVLKEALASSDFSTSTRFNEVVGQAVAIQDDQKRFESYLNLLDIKSNDSEAVVQFLGAREPNASQILRLQKNVGIGAEQAEKLYKQLQKSLGGELL